MSPNESSNKDADETAASAAGGSETKISPTTKIPQPNTAPDEARSADEVKADFDKDPANVSDGTEATPGPVGVEAAPDQAQLPDDPDELRKQIEETRAELGDTVEALSAKADVKSQAKAKVDETKDQLRDQQEQAKAKVSEYQTQVKDNPTPVAAVAGGLVAFLLLIFLIRRRDS